VIITNDTESTVKLLITRYARRMTIEQRLAEIIRAFHADPLSSTVNLNVDLDIMLCVLAKPCAPASPATPPSPRRPTTVCPRDPRTDDGARNCETRGFGFLPGGSVLAWASDRAGPTNERAGQTGAPAAGPAFDPLRPGAARPRVQRHR
jgi:hypothetical protein